MIYNHKSEERKMSDKDKIMNLEGDDLDAALMAAIDETDREEEEARQRRIEAEQERAEQARVTAIEDNDHKAKIDELRRNNPNLGERFFLVAENNECNEQNNTAVLRGSLFGGAKVGDEVFLYRNDGKVLPTKIISIEALNGGIYEPVNEARAKSVVITIEIDYKKTGFTSQDGAPKYSVLTSVKPPVADDKGRAPVENPALLGLSLKHTVLRSDKDFTRAFLQNLVNGRFIVPAHTSDEAGPDGKKKLQIMMLMDKEHPERKMFPLFTDVRTLALWKDILKQEKKPSIVALSFPEAVNFVMKDKFDIALNPMGPAPVFIPNKVVESVSEQLKKGGNVKKEVITDGSKIMIGPPVEDAETMAVRSALVSYCQSNKSVKKAGLLLIKRSSRVSWFVITDAPKGSEQEVFKGILDAVRPHLKKIGTVDFSLLADTPFAKDYFSKKNWDYISK